MPNYLNGQIYTIKCKTDDTLIYVGSTTQTLSKRWGGHKSRSKEDGMMNRLIYNKINNDWDNWFIEPHTIYPCNSKEELMKKEGEIIRQIGSLNKVVIGRTRKEWNEFYKEDIKIKRKKYREDPIRREKILQDKRDDYQKRKNTEKYMIQSKQYRDKRKEKKLIKQLEV